MTRVRTWLSWLPLCFPLYLVRLSLGPVPTTVVELLVLGVLLAALLGSGTALWHGLRDPKLRWWEQPLWPIVLLVAAATVGLALVPATTAGLNGPVASRLIALGVWKGWIVVPALYGLAALAGARDAAWREQALRAFTLSGLVIAAWAIWQYGTGSFTTLDGRAAGPFSSANYLSLYLAPIVVGAGLRTLVPAKPADRWHWAAASLVLLAALAVSRSYAGLLSAAAGLGAGCWLQDGVPARTKWRATLAGLGGLAIAFFLQHGTDKFRHLFDAMGPTSTHIRLQIYEVSLRLAAAHPLLGIGLGQFDTQWPLQAPVILGGSPIDWVVLHPHNLYLAFWLNAGLAGLLAFLWLAALLVRRGARAPFPIARIGLAMAITVLAYGLVDTPFWKNDLAYSWWLIVALTL